MEYDEFLIWEWNECFLSYSTEEWASRAAGTGGWSYQDWLTWFTKNMSRWSSLVWSLDFLRLTPNLLLWLVVDQITREDVRRRFIRWVRRLTGSA